MNVFMSPNSIRVAVLLALLTGAPASAHASMDSSLQAKAPDAAAATQALPAAAETAAEAPSAAAANDAPVTVIDAKNETSVCEEFVKDTVRPQNRARLGAFCQRISRIDSCSSVEGRPIHHVESISGDARGKRILVLGLIHGDEPLAGEMALEWAYRVNNLKSGYRNSWRVIPMLNPDGLKRKTRMNARGVDLNRNFPTKDWPEEAVSYWKTQAKEDPRRFPGETPGSEAEVKCAIAHIKDFKPDFIVSVHTPYKVLDFDGPKMSFPSYKDLPWRALGNFPGSLGRFMWRDYQVPVLTVELGMNMVDSAQLQDIVGSFAIEASRRSGKKMAGLLE